MIFEVYSPVKKCPLPFPTLAYIIGIDLAGNILSILLQLGRSIHKAYVGRYDAAKQFKISE